MQTSLFSMKLDKSFGGELLKGKRKSARPLCTKRTIHLVMRAEEPKLKRRECEVREIITKAAKRWGVRIYKWAIAGDHIHLLIRIPTRRAYRYFIQRISGAISLKIGIKWMFRPFTRVVEWGRAFKRAKNYITMNFYEAQGFIEHQPRGKGATKRRPWFSGATV
jgi:REP element-mobilizing transposase RayT